MGTYKITYTSVSELYVQADSRSEAMAEFLESTEIDIAIGDMLSLSNVHVEFAGGDVFRDRYNLRPGDEITITIGGGHEEPVTGAIREIEYLDDKDSSKLGAAKIVLENGWQGIAKLSEVS